MICAYALVDARNMQCEMGSACIITIRPQATACGTTATAAAAAEPRVCLDASSTGVPGLALLLEFVTLQQEEELLHVIDAGSWLQLSKRRVQHHGAAFDYASRGVNAQAPRAPLPAWARVLADSIQARSVPWFFLPLNPSL